MVTIIGVEKRTSEDGKKDFNVLILQGGIEAVRSKATGKNYITARKANIVCTFDEATAKELIGGKLPGSIEKQSCEPYEYKIPQSGEVVQLDYTYVYTNEGAENEEAVFA